MYTLQAITAWFRQRVCRHKWKRVKHHGLPNEPDLMQCNKCRWMRKTNFDIVE